MRVLCPSSIVNSSPTLSVLFDVSRSSLEVIPKAHYTNLNIVNAFYKNTHQFVL